MYKNILVPVSFDVERDTKGALEVAQKLASEGAVIRLLHVIEVIPEYAMHQVPPDYIKEAEAKIERRLEALAETVPGGVATVVHGHSGRSIIDFTADTQADLVIVASHRPGMQNLLLGSTATQVVRHVKCAVHVLR